MDQLKLVGGNPLKGRVEVSGAKNAALPILISSLLTAEPCDFERVPDLQDVRTALKLLKSFGAEILSPLSEGKLQIQTPKITSVEAPYDLVKTMRASVVVLGPLLARHGKAKVSLPGGCAIGARPINYHLTGLEKLGARITLEGGYVIAEADRLKGNRVGFEFPSVGATENLMMAACLAQGESLLENCAKEPEIVDLARALRSMGAEIEGEGTESIRIQGKDKLGKCKHSIIGDRIEAGTYLCAALATGGSVEVSGVEPAFLEAVLVKLEEAGAEITRRVSSIQLRSRGRPRAVDITTLPYPGFPTDMQAQFMATMTVAAGPSLITETIFENRIMHVSELSRLGAEITIRGNTAQVKGKDHLIGAPIMATDLRASASLLIGGLCAQGQTIISRIYHLDRGYERVEEKFRKLGAKIERIKA